VPLDGHGTCAPPATRAVARPVPISMAIPLEYARVASPDVPERLMYHYKRELVQDTEDQEIREWPAGRADVYTVVWLVQDWTHIDKVQETRKLLMPIWLTLGAFPSFTSSPLRPSTASCLR
jgi:hypothetical protein